MRFQGFVGPAYTLKSVNVDCQRCVNLFPEIIESGSGKEAQVAYLKGTPGLEKLMNIGAGPIRLIHVMNITKQSVLFPDNRVIIVSGNKVFGATFNGTTWSTAEIGTIGTSSGPVSCGSAGYSEAALGDGFSSVICDGDKGYLYRISVLGGVLSETLSTYPTEWDHVKPSHVVLIDGYFILNKVGTGMFYVSNWNSPAMIDPLSFASSEGDPDTLISMISNNRLLWLFNERTTEVWSNTGNADFPFERISGGFIEKGCVAGFSVAKIDGVVLWLGRDESGQGVIYAAQGLTPQRISTHAIEEAIAGYADIKSATAYTYQSEGHSFYVLNFAEATWVYDLSTKLWHEMAHTYDGNLQRHRGNVHAFFPQYGLHLVGDHSSNKVYKFNSEYFTDDGDAITRMRTSPHISGGFKRLFCSSFQLDMETGVGLDGDVLGSDPKVMMDFSDDGGHTWSNESWVSAGQKIGGIGQFKTRVIWRRLGSFFDRVFRIKITDPVKVVILGADIEVRGGK